MGSHGIVASLRRSKDLPGLLFLAATVAFVFLPAATVLTYYRDDWYYMLDGISAGPSVFLEMFSIDRPARGILFSALFSAFGPNPLPYHLISFGLRLGSAFAAYWVFSQLWPGKRSAPLWGALLFALYPGYLWWVAGIEYLPMMLSLFLQVLSIGLTLAAVRARTPRAQALYWVASIATGWTYLALVEYAIGIELFRFLCVFVVVGGLEVQEKARSRFTTSLKAWLPAALIPLGFLAWRLLVFEGGRSETDVAVQLGVLLQEPVLTTLRWGVNLIRSWTNLVIFAWGVPLSEELYGLRLADLGKAFLAALAVVGAIGLHRLWSIRRSVQPAAREASADLRDGTVWMEALVIGALGALAAAVPVVVANRVITFSAYSHYALPGSLAASVVLVASLQLLRSRVVSLLILAGLLAAATLTHRAIATWALVEQEETAQFWRQVAWRAPGFQPGTTFFVKYPSFSYADDVSIVWGPANLIYAVGIPREVPVPYSYSAVAYPDTSLDEITSGEDHGRGAYRTHSVPTDFGKLVVAAQTLPGACVRILDGQAPLLVPDDPLVIQIAAPHSRIDQIHADASGASVPEWLFGPEPDHGWCYFFQKAELALQRGEFERVPGLAQEASERGLKPLVGVEWIPFARAYAFLEMRSELEAVASKINAVSVNRRRACQALLVDRPPGYALSDSMYDTVFDLFCD
ncbi:MAG TPA: hypothetical protein VLL77_03025 [Anaerolineales bacterium]|nr:hypothetical protein [Anaerolineales bacterium]